MAGKGKATVQRKPATKRKPAGKTKKKPAKRTAKKGGAAKNATALVPTGDAAAAAAKFERDLLIRGEAARLDQKGKLPLDATHEIVEGGEGEPPKIERRRFKMW